MEYIFTSSPLSEKNNHETKIIKPKMSLYYCKSHQKFLIAVFFYFYIYYE